MKFITRTRHLAALLLLLTASFVSAAQDGKVKECIDIDKYKNMVAAIFEGEIAIKNLALADSVQAKMKKEIARKEDVIVKTLDQRNLCYDEVRSLKEEITLKDVILASRQKTISDLQKKAKPKRWGFGPQAGYGVSTGRPGAYFGLGISFDVIRW